MKRISATELVSIVKCEKQSILNKERKFENDAYTEARRIEGIKAHAAFEKQNIQDKRCYIATAIYGQSAYETKVLRIWRDNYLQHTQTGKIIIKIYYKMSPLLLRNLSPKFIPFTKYVLNKLIKRIDK